VTASPGRLLVAPPPGRILVVDDTEVNRDLLTRRLRALGHEVETAVHGRAALEHLADRPTDLVLLDIMMPEMDGFEVLERLRADARLRTIPVIMISAVDEIEAVARAIELGATDYLPKPFNAVVLKARVTATLEKKRLEDAERQHTRELERELEIGRQIQREFLPDSLPQPAGWEIAAAFHPARQVAGDFYDAFALEDGRVAITVGDVCDKGVGAALFMALFRSLLRSHAELHGAGTPAEPAARSIVALTNDFIARTHGRSNMFATIFFGLLDPRTGALAWVNGGQEPPAIRRRSGPIERLAPTGPAVGAMPGMEFTAKTTVLAPGDLFLAFTDGASEARRPGGSTGRTASSAFSRPRRRTSARCSNGSSPESALTRAARSPATTSRSWAFTGSKARTRPARTRPEGSGSRRGRAAGRSP
jgi:serine phosphatase RsbU (regulator of sigma subunit)